MNDFLDKFYNIMLKEGLLYGLLAWVVMVLICVWFGWTAFGLSFLACVLANTETRLRLGSKR